MRIMWITSMTQVISLSQSERDMKTSGGWITATAKGLEESDNVEKLIIISVNRDIKEDKMITDGKKVVYFIKANHISIRRDKSLERKFQKIIEKEKPDIIDVQGVEFSFGRSLINSSVSVPFCVTLQGFAGSCAKVYTRGIPMKELLFGRTRSDNRYLRGIIERKLLMYIRMINERKTIKKVKYCIGRTHFDESESKKINPKVKYFSCKRILRSDFYSYQWNIKNVEKHKIFGIQSGVPYKGLHYAVKVIAKLKEKYPDVVLEVPGGFKIDESISKVAGYPKHIDNLLDEYDVRENIRFQPPLNPIEMVNHLMSSRVFYQYSMIENSPNSLSEAQIIGVPVVASNVGGTSSYVEDGVSGILFEAENIEECAEKISRIFEDDVLCQNLSYNGKRIAEERHDIEKNTKKRVSIYKDIISDSIKE